MSSSFSPCLVRVDSSSSSGGNSKSLQQESSKQHCQRCFNRGSCAAATLTPVIFKPLVHSPWSECSGNNSTAEDWSLALVPSKPPPASPHHCWQKKLLMESLSVIVSMGTWLRRKINFMDLRMERDSFFHDICGKTCLSNRLSNLLLFIRKSPYYYHD